MSLVDGTNRAILDEEDGEGGETDCDAKYDDEEDEEREEEEERRS